MLSRNLTSADTGRDRLALGASFSPVIAVNTPTADATCARRLASPPQPVMLGIKPLHRGMSHRGIQLAIRDFDEQPHTHAPSIRRRAHSSVSTVANTSESETNPNGDAANRATAASITRANPQHRLGQHHRIHCVICYRISRGTTGTGQRDPAIDHASCRRITHASITVHHWNHPSELRISTGTRTYVHSSRGV